MVVPVEPGAALNHPTLMGHGMAARQRSNADSLWLTHRLHGARGSWCSLAAPRPPDGGPALGALWLPGGCGIPSKLVSRGAGASLLRLRRSSGLPGAIRARAFRCAE